MAKLKIKEYEKALEPLALRWSEAARWIAETGQRLLIIFEGRDTAGKGGAIGTLAEPLNPRQCQIVALSTPTKREQGEWYFQRYVSHLPAAGEVALFDRSWYNRAGVERVMNFCTPEETTKFLKAVPGFEKSLVDDGILLFKYWLCCDQDKQEERFAERLDDPMKRWKLSPIDQASRERYDDYTEARERMLAATHTKHAPWTLVDFNNQRRGRLTLIADLLDRLPATNTNMPAIEWPPLSHPPHKERFGKMKPIDSFGSD